MKLHHECEFMELKKKPKPTTPKILIHTSPGPVLLQLPLLLEDLGLPWKGFLTPILLEEEFVPPQYEAVSVFPGARAVKVTI